MVTSPECKELGAPPTQGATHHARHSPRKPKAPQGAPAPLDPTDPPAMGRAWKMVCLQGRVSKQQGSRQKARTCSEKMTMGLLRMNNTLLAESPQAGTPATPVRTGSGPSAPGAPMQAKIEIIKKAIAEAAGIRRRDSGEGDNTSPP